MSRNFLAHLHAPHVSRHALRPTTTLGLGVACLACLGILAVTGLTLFLYYVPARDQAYERILHISTTLRYGGIVRNLHYLAANALLILGLLHLTRVVLTGSYKGRWLNWCYGLALFCLVMAANFTGYILPWDQVSYWAIKVGSSLAEYVPLVGPVLEGLLLGGEDIGPETLLRTFAWHAGILPLGLFLLTGLHLWRIRKDGGLAGPQPSRGKVLPASPWLYRAGGGVALTVLAVLLVLALAVDAPLHERPNPGHPPNPAKAPWYFVGIQEMISHSTLFGGMLIPGLMGMGLFLLPVLDRSTSPGGRWWAADRHALITIFLLALMIQVACIVVGQWLRGPNWKLVIPF